ncbi:13929_t:CDS:2, partial [Funneliformis geosporum]
NEEETYEKNDEYIINNKNAGCDQENEKKGREVDPIAKLFKLIQINAKHTYRSEIKKSYFKAEIFLQICCICNTSEDIVQIDDQLPYCQECHSLPGEKRLMDQQI